MEKLGFGALLKTSFKRCVERRLSHLVAIQLLLTFLALLPFLIGMIASVCIISRRDPADGLLILKIYGALALYYLPCSYFLCLVAYGMMRETLRPEPRIGRGLKSGFARWKIALYPVPWFIAAVFISWISKSLLARLPARLPVGGPGNELLRFAVGEVSGFAVTCVIGAVSQLLMCAVAASDTRVGFGELYRRTGAAIRNGWGRCLGGVLAVIWTEAL